MLLVSRTCKSTRSAPALPSFMVRWILIDRTLWAPEMQLQLHFAGTKDIIKWQSNTSISHQRRMSYNFNFTTQQSAFLAMSLRHTDLVLLGLTTMSDMYVRESGSLVMQLHKLPVTVSKAFVAVLLSLYRQKTFDQTIGPVKSLIGRIFAPGSKPAPNLPCVKPHG